MEVADCEPKRAKSCGAGGAGGGSDNSRRLNIGEYFATVMFVGRKGGGKGIISDSIFDWLDVKVAVLERTVDDCVSDVVEIIES